MASVVDAERRFEFPNILISVHSPSSSASCPPPPPSSSSSSSPPSFSPSTASASSSSSSSPSGKSEVVARFSADGDAIRLRFHQGNDDVVVEFDLGSSQILALSPTESICIDNFHSNKLKRSYSRAVTMTFRTEEESQSFHQAFEQWKCAGGESGAVSQLEKGFVSTNRSKFDEKIESASAKMYFHYYGQLLHQQNMLQDYVRTGTYYAAVIENRVDFQDRIVVDVGAGSGILSLFAAQAGAKHVYAIEASDMVDYARQLISGNPLLEQRITVVKGKVEEVELPEKADILISEPMGTLLVNERMLESYVIARDRFLTSDGKMFPTLGRIHMAPFSDEYLYVEIANKALFWQQNNYYGVDLTPLYGSAFKGYFAQPVVDAFDPRLLVAPAVFHTLDFSRMKEEDLYEIDIPLHFVASVGTRVHGLACWFDVLFDGSSVQRWLTTAPGAPTTHWYQLRCVLSQPLYVMAGQEITGQLHLVAHNAQSYTMHLTMTTKMWGAGAEQGGVIQMSSGKMDLKEPYYRMSQPQPYAWVQDQQPHQLMQSQETALLSQDVSSSGVISTQGSGP
ncbi:probable histone-arginine methyltransferase CARM1 isoform X2 [Nymphaea colorata]|uniref:probable histone-arginine methyltransferase CARM1 isoform X2 n=1 Tax=Nymphaea colorata TaxID=210225 RepID=UPI00129D5CAA|nr:probable histone-arginine methyltransferase CARM1 isoform X2 [Nymphaea colorata]